MRLLALPFLFLPVLLHGCSAAAPGAGDAVPERPNIVLLFVDDLGYGELGCQGTPEIPTPHIDKLASQGRRFANAFVTTSICAASRATILTGQYEYAHGTNFGKGKMSRADFVKTYPMLLRDAGYLTAFAGKFGVDLEGKKLFTVTPSGQQAVYSEKRLPPFLSMATRAPSERPTYG